MACEIVNRIEGENDIRIGTLIMDDDSTTVSRIRSELDHDVVKLSDISHVKCHLKNDLYKLQAKHRSLTTTVITYLVNKCFSYALMQNKNEPENLKKAIENIVPHVFDNHKTCGTWCRFRKNPKCTYTFLPNGKALTGELLYNDLVEVFSNLAKRADKIAACASTSVCENFNHMVASKAPKARHYSSSGSLNTRVACCVGQKNDGHKYLSDVFVSAGMSPGRYYTEHSEKQDRKVKRDSYYHTSVPFKRRRLSFSQHMSEAQKSNELREGKTYMKGVDSEAILEDDISTIPAPIEAPIYRPVRDSNLKQVYFDIETTSLQSSCDIIQLAGYCEGSMFNSYVRPEQNISQMSSDVTGIVQIEGKMFYNGREVACMTIKKCLLNFIDWCQSRSNGQVVLVGHNCKVFDAPRLLRKVRACGLIEPFEKIVVGFIDTLPVFRKLYKGRFRCFSQENLATELLGITYKAHNASDDAKTLAKIVNGVKLSKQSLFENSFGIAAVLQMVAQHDAKTDNEESLGVLVEKRVISKSMVARIAKSGLSYKHLCLAFKRNKDTGIKTLLGERDCNNKIRVTQSKRITSALKNYFSAI